MEYFIDIVLLFFFASFVGWCVEVILKYFEFKRFVNRGILFGPWLPIYGVGTALITVAIDYTIGSNSSLFAIFDISFIICGTIEYLASFFMEKLFHARWWDYSKKPMNLNGRVWIGNLILFGIAGLVVIKLINPVFLVFLKAANYTARTYISAILSIIFIADIDVSHLVLKLVKISADSSEADNTEEVNEEIRLILSNKSIFYKRFADAYPNVIYRTDKIKARIEEIRLETEKFKKEFEEKRADFNNQLEESKIRLQETLEPTSKIKNDIISKQSHLIELLYDENTATDTEKSLKVEIDNKFDRLQNRHININIPRKHQA